MNFSTYRFTLDIQSDISQVSIPVKLNDTGRKFLIGLTDGGNPYPIAKGSLAFFSYKKTEPNEDGKYDADVHDCTIEDNLTTISYELLPSVTNVAGVVDCEIWLYGPNGRQITTPRFILVVDERVMSGEDYTLPEEKLSVLDSILVSEAERADAESKRVEAEEARETACQEAVENANRSAQHAEQASELALSSVELVHESLNYIFPTPTKNEAKKLTEEGYYAVYAMFSGCPIFSGVFYYRPSILDFEIDHGAYVLCIASNGSMSVKSISYTVSGSSVSVVKSIFPSPYEIYTAKLS